MASIYKNSVVTLVGAVVVVIALLGHERLQVNAFEPLVDTGVSKLSADGRHVAVHVPGLFNLLLDTRGNGQGARMSQRVMSGLVDIFMDRMKQGNTMQGPIRVKVAGLTIYNNGQPDLQSSSADSANTREQNKESVIADNLSELGRDGLRYDQLSQLKPQISDRLAGYLNTNPQVSQ